MDAWPTDNNEGSLQRDDLVTIAAGNANMDLVAHVAALPLNDEKIRIETIDEYPGGSASNYAVAMARLGGRTGFLGCVGDDDAGRRLITALKDDHVDVSYVEIGIDRTGFALVAATKEGRHFTLGYPGANAKLSPLRFPIEYLGRAKILHLSSITPRVLFEAITIAKRTGIPLSLDPGQSALRSGLNKLKTKLRSASLLFLNQVEFETLTGEPPNPANTQALAQELATIVSVQRGAQGVYVCLNSVFEEIPAFPVHVVDTTGAGDTYAAAFTMGLLKGYDLRESATYGCAAAALKCLKPGARQGMPTHDQTIQYLARHHALPRKSALVDGGLQTGWLKVLRATRC